MAVGDSSGCVGSCITTTTLQSPVCYCEYQRAFDGYQALGISLSFNHFGFLFVFLPVQRWHTREWQLSLLWRFQRHSLPHLCKPKQARRELWWRLVTDGETRGKCRTRIMVQIHVYWIPFCQDQHHEWQKCRQMCPFKQQWRKHVWYDSGDRGFGNINLI